MKRLVKGGCIEIPDWCRLALWLSEKSEKYWQTRLKYWLKWQKRSQIELSARLEGVDQAHNSILNLVIHLGFSMFYLQRTTLILIDTWFTLYTLILKLWHVTKHICPMVSFHFKISFLLRHDIFYWKTDISSYEHNEWHMNRHCRNSNTI